MNPESIRLTQIVIDYKKKPSNDALQKIIDGFTPLVRKLAHKLPSGKNYEIEDLIQEGYVGLIKAVNNFDESKNMQFITLAHHYINGYMLHYIRDYSHLIRVPGHIMEAGKSNGYQDVPDIYSYDSLEKSDFLLSDLATEEIRNDQLVDLMNRYHKYQNKCSSKLQLARALNISVAGLIILEEYLNTGEVSSPELVDTAL